ncbi:MAG: hypothetical protein H3C51_05215 [Rubellimicrobium sp.]|nr:hypothetical protein [Rubellimicrobium sp.]
MRRGLIALCIALAAPAFAQDDSPPLSAIDWLSQSVGAGSDLVTGGTQAPVADPGEPPISDSAATPEITVRSLDAAPRGGLGLLPASITGLPADLWSGSRADILAALITAEGAETLPALRELFTTLLLAEADPPQGDGPGSDFFLARVDKLLDLGALEPAQALLERADREEAEIFRRWFDVSLLTGTEDEACRFMDRHPALAPTLPARIFCLMRKGDWDAAMLTLGTGRALGQIDGEDDRVLTLFLDPEAAEGAAPLPPPARPSPLIYRLREALGEPIATATLPRAFAHADLRDIAPWRSRMEAAERLVRVGAISPNVLFALYMQETPAASGGIWDRARAIQTLEAALDRGPDAIATALPPAWEAMAARGAGAAFAEYYGPRLVAAGLTGEAGALAWRIGLLSPDYEAVAQEAVPAGDGNAVLAAVARGDVAGLSAHDARTDAVLTALADPVLPDALTALPREGRLGEAILRVLAQMAPGIEGDPLAVTEGLAFLRSVGLEDITRRAALQYLILAP